MRNVQRKREASPATTESKRRSLNPFDAYKLWPKARTTGIFEKDANGIIFEKDGDGMIIEKDGDGMARELEANTVGGRGRRWSFNPFGARKQWPKARITGIFEKDGDSMIRELEANTVGGRMKYTMPRQSLVELPGDSSYYR
jgi:hypothetical protein